MVQLTMQFAVDDTVMVVQLMVLWCSGRCIRRCGLVVCHVCAVSRGFVTLYHDVRHSGCSIAAEDDWGSFLECSDVPVRHISNKL